MSDFPEDETRFIEGRPRFDGGPARPGAGGGNVRKAGPLSSVIRLTILVIIALLLVLPFTPFAGKIKRGIKEILAARSGKPEVIIKEVDRPVEKRVEVPREIVREVVKEVPVQEPLPERYIPRKEVDVATLYNGITIQTKLQTEQGTFASLERQNADAYKAEFQLSIRVPKANQTVAELARINPDLPKMLPDLEKMLTGAKVSGFFHKLYENKTAGIQRDLTRLNRVLDRHNFFDCETILEITHPDTKRNVLLIQSEMDVVCDGSDGDRMPTLDEYIYMSDYYQPFTSYVWPKTSKNPNPLLPRWEERLKKAKEQFAQKGLPADRNRDLKALITQLELEIAEMKSRSSLIADKDPFIVLSLMFLRNGAGNKFTPKMGDYAVVVHNGKLYPAICGDYGPTFKMGEASLFMAKALNPKASPYSRPESDLKVTYLVFPDTAEKPNTPPDLARWHERCATYLKELGGPGAGYELHQWEDPFKKPEPVPTTTPAAPGMPATGTPPPPAAGPGTAPPAGTPAPATQAPPAAPGAPAASAPATPPTVVVPLQP